jgi:uncharacterized protein YbcI
MIDSPRLPREALSHISTRMVQLYREYYGRGPTKAKTDMVDDTVVCLLREGFTTLARTLIDDGKQDDVEALRRSFQHTMRRQVTSVVEEATGRKVIAYMSQVHSNPDLAVEVFLLQPAH